MLARLIEWSVRNVFLVLVMAIAVTGGGIYALLNTPLDAQPDLSDVQVIVFADVPGQAPQVVEDQVTFPLSTAMLAVPRSKVVRGISMFGASYVYVIFEDGTDIYWARARVLEYLNAAAKQMPAGVTPTLGPDATGELFVPFRDATSGGETYGGGRYLDLPVAPLGRYALDFNRAYHPYCVYSDAYSCPLPPAENTMALAVRAGERLRPEP